MNQGPSRLALGIAIPATALLVGFVPYLVFRSELPERLASHFDGSGTPDGSLTVTGFVIATSVLMAVGSALCVGLSVIRRPLADVVGSVTGFLGGFLAGLGAAILAGTVISQRGIEQWQDADSPWWVVLAALLLATTLGAAGAMASVIDVRPMQWGGWGYRGSLKLMRKAAVVHRAGPGIRLDLTDGRVFVVTLDNPEVPVALLNTEAGRQQLVT